MDGKVDTYIQKYPQWQDALQELRNILLNTELKEEIKWGIPYYTLGGKNVVGLVAFKTYTGLWFQQGVFLKDRHNLLEQSSDSTKGMRKMVFHSLEEIRKNTGFIKEYIHESIENQKKGKEITITRSNTVEIPRQLQDALDMNSELQVAFNRLTPGKQREYAEFILSAKQEATKDRRITKISELILEGLGLNEKYK